MELRKFTDLYYFTCGCGPVCHVNHAFSSDEAGASSFRLHGQCAAPILFNYLYLDLGPGSSLFLLPHQRDQLQDVVRPRFGANHQQEVTRDRTATVSPETHPSFEAGEAD